MKKKIYLIVPQSKVNSNQDTWKDDKPLYAVKTLKQALKDCKMHNEKSKVWSSENKYLLFRYRIEIMDMYL